MACALKATLVLNDEMKFPNVFLLTLLTLVHAGGADRFTPAKKVAICPHRSSLSLTKQNASMISNERSGAR